MNVENFSVFALSDPRLELWCGDAPYHRWRIGVENLARDGGWMSEESGGW